MVSAHRQEPLPPLAHVRTADLVVPSPDGDQNEGFDRHDQDSPEHDTLHDPGIENIYQQLCTIA